MVKKMPEAARLYFENWDVLDTAREELISVLDGFWPEAWHLIQERLEEAEVKTPRVWENKSSPGKWSLTYGEGKQRRGTKKAKPKSANIQVWIWDPRASDSSNCYSVRLRCSAANQQRIEETFPGAKAAIDRIAKNHELDLDWGEAKRIWERQISLDPEDFAKTCSEVADTVVELLKFSQAVDEAVVSSS